MLLGALVACAQTTVQPVREALDVTMPRPQTVLVYKFAVNMAEVQENRGIFQKAIDAAESTTKDEQTRKIAQDVSNRLADELVVRITELGLPAQRASRDTYVPSGAVVVAGHFVDIDEGNRARRLIVGFGAVSRRSILRCGSSHPLGVGTKRCWSSIRMPTAARCPAPR